MFGLADRCSESTITGALEANTDNFSNLPLSVQSDKTTLTKHKISI